MTPPRTGNSARSTAQRASAMSGLPWRPLQVPLRCAGWRPLTGTVHRTRLTGHQRPERPGLERSARRTDGVPLGFPLREPTGTFASAMLPVRDNTRLIGERSPWSDRDRGSTSAPLLAHHGGSASAQCRINVGSRRVTGLSGAGARSHTSAQSPSTAIAALSPSQSEARRDPATRRQRWMVRTVARASTK